MWDGNVGNHSGHIYTDLSLTFARTPKFKLDWMHPKQQFILFFYRTNNIVKGPNEVWNVASIFCTWPHKILLTDTSWTAVNTDVAYLEYIVTFNCVRCTHLSCPYMCSTPRTQSSKSGFHLSLYVYLDYIVTSNSVRCTHFVWLYMCSTPKPSRQKFSSIWAYMRSILGVHSNL